MSTAHAYLPENRRCPALLGIPSRTPPMKLEIPSRRSNTDVTLNASPTVVPFNTPSPSISELAYLQSNDDIASTLAVGFLSTEASTSQHLSLISDISEDDEESNTSSSFDSLLSSVYTLPQRSSIHPTARGIGLGISGLAADDSDTVFYGIGLLGSKNNNQEKELESEQGPAFPTTPMGYTSDTVSEIILHEILLTFIEDPRHRLTTPSSKGDSTHQVLCPVMTMNNGNETVEGRRRLSTRNRHFSLPTISSELKRTLNIRAVDRKASPRTRSASCSMLSSGYGRNNSCKKFTQLKAEVWRL